MSANIGDVVDAAWHFRVYLGAAAGAGKTYAATAVELGGTVTQPAMDTPYGRLAGAADPTGALFKLIA
jgi:hypothetical protein